MMLVLNRKLNEGIYIGHDIRIVVVAVSGRKVKLGIECPDDVTVRRQEKVMDCKEEA